VKNNARASSQNSRRLDTHQYLSENVPINDMVVVSPVHTGDWLRQTGTPFSRSHVRVLFPIMRYPSKQEYVATDGYIPSLEIDIRPFVGTCNASHRAAQIDVLQNVEMQTT
jgi:hypothetical protein